MLDIPRLEKSVNDVRLDTRGTYFDPVALIVALLRGDARRAESLGWILDAVKAETTPLALASKMKMGRKCMAISARREARQRLHLTMERVRMG